MPSDKNTRRQRHQAQVKTQPGKAVRGAQSTEFVKKAGYRKSEFIGGKKYYTPMSTDPTSSGAGGDVTNVTISGGGGSVQGAVLADGTIPFNSAQSGVSPTETAHLATKGYVDDQLATKDTIAELGDVTLSGSPSTGQSLKWTGSAWQNQTTATGISSVTGYDVSSDGYGSAVSGNTGLKFNDDYDTGASTGIYFEVTDSGNDTIVTPNIVGALTDNNDNTTYSTSWVDSSDNAILRLTAGGSGSGNDDLTIVAGGNITLTPSGDNLTIAANNTTSYSLDNASGLPGGTQTLVMLSSGTQGIVRGLKPGSNITMSTTDSDSDTGYVTVNASLSGATVVVAEANPLGGWLNHTSSTIRFIDNGKISWALSGDGATTTVTPTIASYSAADVGALASNHAASNITSSHITVLGNTSGTNSGDVCSSNHTGAGYLTSNQTITLSGDCSGSGTTSISVTVADDSHNHIIGNVDGLQSALDAKAALSADVTFAALTCTTLNTGQGATEVYLMNQNVKTDSDVQVDSFGVGTAASGTTGEIRATNEVTAYYSDDRLKNKYGNIENALEKVCSLNGFHYQANEVAGNLGYDTTKKKVGVSAQEVLKVLPEAVTEAPIDPQYHTVQYEKLVPLLVEAIKELNERKCSCGV